MLKYAIPLHLLTVFMNLDQAEEISGLWCNHTAVWTTRAPLLATVATAAEQGLLPGWLAAAQARCSLSWLSRSKGALVQCQSLFFK